MGTVPKQAISKPKNRIVKGLVKWHQAFLSMDKYSIQAF